MRKNVLMRITDLGCWLSIGWFAVSGMVFDNVQFALYAVWSLTFFVVLNYIIFRTK